MLADLGCHNLPNRRVLYLQEALDRIMTGRTSVVVAHRLSTIRNANSIAVVYRCVLTCKRTLLRSCIYFV